MGLAAMKPIAKSRKLGKRSTKSRLGGYRLVDEQGCQRMVHQRDIASLDFLTNIPCSHWDTKDQERELVLQVVDSTSDHSSPAVIHWTATHNCVALARAGG